MTEDLLERMHMADQDDDDADLEQLKQLRQIWLAMPEEEPPTRGLDALMAAARTQAAAMEPKPSWWKRLLAQLVRPPALALATIVVVAGGAVLVNRHHDELEATRAMDTTVAPPALPSAAGSAAPLAPRDEGRLGGAEGEAVPSMAPDVQTGAVDKSDERRTRRSAAGDAEVNDKAPVVTTKPPAQVVRPATPKKSVPTTEDRSTFEHRQQPVEGNDDEVASPKDVVLSERSKADPAPTPTPPPPAPRPPPPAQTSASRGGATKVGGAQLATDDLDTARPDSVASLMRRAHEAAGRGDCAATKALAAQIGKLDVSYYRTTVLKDPAVVKCL